MAQRPFKVQFGTPTTTEIPFVVISPVSGNVTVTVNDVDYPVTLGAAQKLGDDRGSADANGETFACYVNNDRVTGLASNTRYVWSAVQGANSQSGTCSTAPAAGEDFRMFFGSCDNNTSFTNGGGLYSDPETITGVYSSYKTLVQNSHLNVVGIFFVDDFGYVDSFGSATSGVVDDSAYTGKQLETDYPQNNPTGYNYAVAWMGMFGLLGDSSNRYIAWGHDADRQWFYDNANVFPQWGDHEFKQDIGWDLPRTDAGMTSQWTHGKAAWDVIMKPLQGPTAQGADGAANHWTADFGDVMLLSIDGITNEDTAVTDHSAASPTAITTLYGANQINDLLTVAAAGSQAFTVFGLGHSIKYMSSAVAANEEQGKGAQHPIKDHCAAEYAQLFTATGNTPPSLIDSDQTNGVNGSLFTLHGDFHCGHVYKHQAAGEGFYEIGIGTVNGSSNFVQDNSVAEDATYDSSLIEYLQSPSGPDASAWHGLYLDFYNSRVPKEAHVTLFKRDAGNVWRKKFINKLYRNEAIDIDRMVAPGIGVSDSVMDG